MSIPILLACCSLGIAAAEDGKSVKQEIKEDFKEAGRAIGEAARKVGQSVKKAAVETGDAVSDEAKEVKKSVQGGTKRAPPKKPQEVLPAGKGTPHGPH